MNTDAMQEPTAPPLVEKSIIKPLKTEEYTPKFVVSSF